MQATSKARSAARRARPALLWLALSLAGCGGWGDEGGPGPDAGVARPDAHAPEDAGATLDASAADAMAGDATPADAAGEDAGPDAGADAGASGEDSGARGDAAADAGPTSFTLAGEVSFDWIPALDDVSEGGVRLDYAAIEERPARRVIVQAVPMLGTRVLAETTTDDLGRFQLEVPRGRPVKVRAVAETRVTGYQPDGVPPDDCAGASWRARVVDNTMNDAVYVLESSSTFSSATTGIDLHARTAVVNGAYRERSGAPFAMIDVLVREFELMCQGLPGVSLPALDVNWSVNNAPWRGDFGAGEIGTSFYSGANGSNLYILGKADVDTDEYDDHVIAHEVGHFFEDRLYRSDSQGGSHGSGDSLDPATAFGEGYGNGISGMVFDDPVYVDTSSGAQSDGFAFDVSAPPTGDDRGVYSETSVQYLMWQMYEGRDATPRSGRYDRIHEVLRNHQRITEAVTSAQSFAAYYNQVYGDADGLSVAWRDGLGTPYDALCAGACTGAGDLADPFDVDNDIGLEYAGAGTSTVPRHYPQGSAATYPPEFWQLYRTLASGTSSTAHDQTRFGGESPGNKLGGVRWYRYLGTGASTQISAADLAVGGCGADLLDMAVYHRGREIARDYSAGGCPSVTFPAANGDTYVVMLFGLDRDVPRWSMSVTPKPQPPLVVTSELEGVVKAGAPRRVAFRVAPTRPWRDLRVSVRGVDGVLVDSAPSTLAVAGGPGEGVRHTARVRVPEGVAGYVVVDVRGRVGGRRVGWSVPFRLAAPGATPLLDALGRFAEDEHGRWLEVLESSR